MKRFILLALSLAVSVSLTAQTWHSYYHADYGLTTLTLSDEGSGSRHFEINPYDNSMWFARINRIQRITGTGQTESHYYGTHSELSPQTHFKGFGFSENFTYAVDENFGLFRYDGMNWQLVYSANDCWGIDVEADTVWVGRFGENAFKWWGGNVQVIPIPFQRFCAKEGDLWASSTGMGGLGTHRVEGVAYVNYTPDNSLIMDNYNNDFKFSPHADTLYVAGQKGLSLLHDLVFFDSIAPDNSTNMPAGVILDFEFDANDNIWALFGTDVGSPYAIAHYDQATENWDAYYDETNSPINFTEYGSIELDTAGNLWMVIPANLYMLELGEVPFWLNTPESAGLKAVSVYPNPSAEVVHIIADAKTVARMVVRASDGQVVHDAAFSSELSVARFASGMYFIELRDENGTLLESRKLVVQ